MSLRAALLALLTAEPLTGYEAAKHFDSSVGHVWNAPDSQIYPELRRMEKEGLVDGRQVPWGPNSTKTRYYVTDAGEQAFREWMDTPLDYGPLRDAAHMQAAYFEWADAERARDHLQRHIEFYSRVLDRWREAREAILARTQPTIAARLQQHPPETHERIVAYKAFAYEGLIARGEAEVDWARRGLELIDSLEPRPAASAGSPP